MFLPLLRFVLFASAVSTLHAEAPSEDVGYFGRSEDVPSALIAIMYDLKQTQNRIASGVSAEEYPHVIRQFLSERWNETVLSEYFKGTQALHATQIFIPNMDAKAAPMAFGMEKLIKPSLWVIHYKGQVSPPEDGTYRFVAFADDVMAVAINGKTVCVGARPDMTNALNSIWRSKEKPGAEARTGDNLVYGDWIKLEKDQPVDMDVLVGERPGSAFCSFLLYQKKDSPYQVDPQGHPILPVFQLATEPVPRVTSETGPLSTRAASPWRGWQ